MVLRKNEIKGLVFDISHYMLEDGPGIRTNVFFKGCPLRCRWCSNPYGLKREQEINYIPHKCVGCGQCIAVCELNCNEMIGESHRIKMDFGKCIQCLKCVDVCPSGARQIIGTYYTAKEILDEVEKDRIFYRRGSGGITLSGGEILLQHEFAEEILRRSSLALVHTAIETSAFGKWNYLQSILNYTDVAFIDCKHMDSRLHKKLTGIDNTLILNNIRKSAGYCLDKNKILVIRLPLIPELNDSKENVQKTAKFVKELEGNLELNILPYHNYGSGKYEYVGREYKLTELSVHSEEKLEQVADWLEAVGIRYSIGGYGVESYT